MEEKSPPEHSLNKGMLLAELCGSSCGAELQRISRRGLTQFADEVKQTKYKMNMRKPCRFNGRVFT